MILRIRFTDFDSPFADEELEGLDSQRFCALFNMAFQNGSCVKFPSMVNAVKEGDWERAADEMLWSNGLKKNRRSAWYKQTPERCQENADMMRCGSAVKPLHVDADVASEGSAFCISTESEAC